jgi:hypothetical protein
MVNRPLSPQSKSTLFTELLAVTTLYVMLVGAGVLTGEADLAGFASLTIFPLGLILGLRRELSMKQKLASVGLLWYVLPIIGFILWVTSYPGRPLYFLVGALCALLFFVCFGFLIQQYWIRRDWL